MGNDNLKKINRVLGEFYQENKLQNGLLEVDVANACKDALGSNLLQYVNDISFQNGTLKLTLSSASLRQELAMGKEKMAELINNQFGTAVVKKVVLL
ncbi:MAG: DciA family protein [Flavobacteriaceae bacterium]